MYLHKKKLPINAATFTESLSTKRLYDTQKCSFIIAYRRLLVKCPFAGLVSQIRRVKTLSKANCV